MYLYHLLFQIHTSYLCGFTCLLSPGYPVYVYIVLVFPVSVASLSFVFIRSVPAFSSFPGFDFPVSFLTSPLPDRGQICLPRWLPVSLPVYQTSSPVNYLLDLFAPTLTQLMQRICALLSEVKEVTFKVMRSNLPPSWWEWLASNRTSRPLPVPTAAPWQRWFSNYLNEWGARLQVRLSQQLQRLFGRLLSFAPWGWIVAGTSPPCVMLFFKIWQIKSRINWHLWNSLRTWTC